MLEWLLEWLPTLASLAAAGVAAGLMAGLLGVGGGIVIVPVLFIAFQSLGVSAGTAMVVATSTSLLTIVPTSISSARAHHARGNVDFSIFRRWALFIVLGVTLGSQVLTRIDGLLVTLVFAVVVLLIAANNLLREGAPPLREELPSLPWQGAIATVIGLLSVLMGIGGGTLSVTAMSSCNVPAHRAVGTSALFGLVIALPGALLLLAAPPAADVPPGTIGMVNLPGFALIAPLSFALAPVGVRMGARLSAQTLKRVFSIFLIVVGLRMLWQGVPALF